MTAYEQADTSFQTKIVSAPIAGGPLRTEWDSAFNVQAVFGGIVTLAVEESIIDFSDYGGSGQDLSRTTGVEFIEPDGTSRTLFEFTDPASDESAATLFGGGEHIALNYRDHMDILSLDGSEALRIEASPESPIAGVATCNGRVTWTRSGESTSVGSDVYVLDIASRAIVQIPQVDSNSGTHCAGEYIAWDFLDDDGNLPVATVARWHPTE